MQVFLITPLERISERAVSDCLCASTSDLGEIVSVVVRLKSGTTDCRAIVDALILRVLSACCTVDLHGGSTALNVLSLS